jgi:hypothetical protein
MSKTARATFLTREDGLAVRDEEELGPELPILGQSTMPVYRGDELPPDRGDAGKISAPTLRLAPVAAAAPPQY